MANFEKETQEIFNIAKTYNKYPVKRYWADFTLSALVAWSSFISTYLASNLFLKLTFFIISVFSIYRILSYTHEVVHLKKNQIPFFREAWSLLCGIPFLVPHFTYRELHLQHHSKKNYGTKNDIEYDYFYGRKKHIILYFLKNAILPFLIIYRYAILSLTLLIPGRLRDLVETKASCMGIKLVFTRNKVKNQTEKKYWVLEETLCAIHLWTMVLLISISAIDSSIILQWAMTIFAVLTLNTYRFLGATHLYKNGEEQKTFKEHILDSVNIEDNSFLTKIIAPLGQDKHALHHIVPNVPGLLLKDLHHDLLRNLPKDHFYFTLSYHSIHTVYSKIYNAHSLEADHNKNLNAA